MDQNGTFVINGYKSVKETPFRSWPHRLLHKNFRDGLRWTL